MRKALKPAGSVSLGSIESKKTASTIGAAANASTMGGEGKGGANAQKNNDWIPTQAVRAILQIKETFNGLMSETCIS